MDGLAIWILARALEHLTRDRDLRMGRVGMDRCDLPFCPPLGSTRRDEGWDVTCAGRKEADEQLI